jgi:anti-anti-sigma factor
MDADDPLDFEVAVKRDGGRLVVAPRGELDLATVPRVEDALRSPEGPVTHITLDLTEVSFMDTSGLRLVLEEEKRATQNGRTYSLVPGPPAVQRIFELSGVADRLPFVAPGDGG